jgi:hypothetical protein
VEASVVLPDFEDEARAKPPHWGAYGRPLLLKSLRYVCDHSTRSNKAFSPALVSAGAFAGWKKPGDASLEDEVQGAPGAG